MAQTQRKPKWLKKNMDFAALKEMEKMMESLSLNTVCSSADCPNRSECFKNHTATFMILGNICTRNCKFCSVPKGHGEILDKDEPKNVAQAAKQLGLKHVVVTSVTRDDLPDNGAGHFAQTIRKIRQYLPDSTIEVLIPDFQGDYDALKTVIDAKPDIINHNIETVKSLYDRVRPMAVYERSLELISRVKEYNPKIFTKSGAMVGLGETTEQMDEMMDDLLASGCDILTIGQYLNPSKDHLPVEEYITPEQFEDYKQIGLQKGFKYVASGPFVRSSYNALEGMDALRGNN